MASSLYCMRFDTVSQLKLCQKRIGMVSLFLSENKAYGIVLNALESVDRGFIYTKEKGIAVFYHSLNADLH